MRRVTGFGFDAVRALGALLGWALLAGPARAATFTVTNTAVSGAGSLRQAIIDANTAGGADIINFAIPGAGVHTISPTVANPLPVITGALTIDGTTQGGYVANGLHTIEIDGTSANAIGLDVGVGISATIIGLNINRYGTAIRFSGNSNIVRGCYLGTDPTGTLARPNGVGIYIRTNTNQIDGTTAAGRNVISGNTVDGIQIDGAGGGTGGSGNIIRGNYIGVTVAGNAALGNGGQGISMFNAADTNTIGGVGVGNVISANNNGIAINSAGSSANVVQGNFIGTDSTGTLSLGNTARGITFDQGSASNTIGGTAAGAGNTIAHNGDQGIAMTNAATVGNSILGNSIFDNGKISGALGIDLNLDWVDTNDTGDGDTGPNNRQNHPILTAAMTNGAGTANIAGSLKSAASTQYRVEFFASTLVHASGYGEGQRFLGSTNVNTSAAGNFTIGLTLAAALTAGEYVTATATVCANGPCTTYGDTSEFSGAVQAVASLVVTTTADTTTGSNTGSVALLIANPGTDGRISLREAILAANATGGTDTITFGIPITDANHFYYQDNGTAGTLAAPVATTLADLSTPSSPTISNYDADYPAGTARSWYRISIGAVLPAITSPLVLDTTTQPLSIPGRGPVVELNGGGAAVILDLQPGSSGSTTRGFGILNGTVFPGGLRIQGSSNNVIVGNFIGTNMAGTAAGPGNAVGIYIGGTAAAANDNIIGGTTAADRNVISANTIDGVELTGGAGGAARTIFQGNYIGTDVTGTLDVGNTNQGIAVFGTNTQTMIGGTAPGAGNVIAGNNQYGIGISTVGTTGTVVQGNKIGVGATGGALPNSQSGFRLDSSTTNTLVGGTTAAAANIIASNTNAGVWLQNNCGSNCASIIGNSIYSNGGVGIDLNGDGLTTNDALDGDGGANDLLNFPLLTASLESGGTLTTHFQLDVPAGSYRIEFFRNPSGADATGFGEGQVFAGARNVTHPGGGPVLFNHTFPGAPGDVITATATLCTDGAACTTFGSTSEFSKALNVATTAVTLLSFSATGSDRAVDLSWTTASELSNLGFQIYRADAAGGPYTRITTSLIPGLGSSPTGQSYTYRDSGLVNGRTYYYQLEDVETTGRTERHGPVSATASSGTGDASRRSSGTAYGDPSGVVLREIERDTSHVLLELLTPGFFAAPAEDGRVRVSIPGFASASGAGEPDLPSRRAMVAVMAGRKVRLSVVASDAVRYEGLRPVAKGAAGLSVDENGTVLTSEENRREGRAFNGVFPRDSAVLLGVGFQGEQKKAEVLFSPLTWDGNALVLSRRLLVRLDFVGTQTGERALGGSRGRRAVLRPFRVGNGLVAQLVAKERGLYAVAFADVFAGRSAGMDVAVLRLSRQGEDVAFHVEPDPTRFAPGSTLHFVSEGSDRNPYGDAVYELETGAPGLLMPVDSASPSSPSVDAYYEEVRREENHYYQAGLLEAPDLWLWDIIVSPGQASYAFAADHVSAALPASVSVSLQGASDFEGVVDHHVRVKVNGSHVGETTWDGKVAKSLDLEVQPGLVHDGTNSLELENVGDTGATYSLVFLNRFSVRYPRALVAMGGMLEGEFASSGQAVVDGLLATSVLVDTTEIPRWRQGASVTPTGLSFPVEAGHRYLATSVLRHPQVRTIQGRTLRKATNQADYLLLAPEAFLTAAQPLLDLRQSEGLRTMAVSLENVYEQFGHGEASPEALKSFLEYAYQSWSAPSPRYVVLLGDASYDPKDYLGTGTRDWLPGFPVKTSYLWTVSDPTYASVNGEDSLPDIAIGRLPAGNVDEAQRLVQKILNYENGGGRLDGSAVLVADNADAAGNFEADADEIAREVLAGRRVRKIYYSQEGASTRSLIEQAFDEGASLMSYVGHGATTVWASENIFNLQDVKNLAPQSRQPLLLTMNCLNGFFHFPPLNSLSEELLKAEEKGAIAAFSPSGLSVDGAAHVYHMALLTEILSRRHARLGDAVLAAQEDYARSGAFPELLSVYNLLGDPALKLR